MLSCSWTRPNTGLRLNQPQQLQLDLPLLLPVGPPAGQGGTILSQATARAGQGGETPTRVAEGPPLKLSSGCRI